MKKGLSRVFKNVVETGVQEWRDISKINFLDIFVKKLNNLTNTEATFEIESDSTLADPMKKLCENLQGKRFTITSGMLADGDYYIFPAHNTRGEIIHSYLTQAQVRILEMDGEDITEAYGIIDWFVDEHNRVFFLLRHHKLDADGTLMISYSSVNDSGKEVAVSKWEYLNNQTISFSNANHIGFGRYKSPADGRGLSPVYGVPLNFGCGDIEKKIFNDLKLIEDEFENGKSKIFTDLRNLDEDKKEKKYKFLENIIPIQKLAGQNGPFVEIFSPAIRQSEHYNKFVSDLELYEKEIGTSKGILTSNEVTKGATATEVKRANADTISLLDRIRAAIDAGNEMTLQADAVFLNVSSELWNYTSDWFDPFEDPGEQWKRLLEAKNNDAAESDDLVRWMFPKLSDEERKEKLERIKSEKTADTNASLENIFAGE